MTLTAFFLILASALLHASWNLLSKARRPSAVFYFQASLTATLVWLPVLLFGGFDFAVLPWHFWLILGASGVAECCYFIGLANAYRGSDISLAYPMLRSLPVLLTGLLTAVFGLGRPPSASCWLGMGLISGGCLIMPLANFGQLRWRTYVNPMIVFILLGACGTTGYTIIDSIGSGIVRAATPEASRIFQSCVYLGMVEPLIALTLAGVVLASRVERREFRDHFLRSPYPVIAGLCSTAAYWLVLLAMGFVDNVSYVQAFRQMSLPICVLAGSILLNERVSRPRLAGFLAVIVGLLLTVL